MCMNNLSWLIFTLLLSCASAGAQFTFRASDLPSQVGQYSRAYISTNVDASGLVGSTGGPQRWDFSHKLQPNEPVRRMDVVAPTDGGHNSDFPNAAYAERYTDETAGTQSWDYYRIGLNVGRTDYGFYASFLGGATVLSPPVVDIPDPLGLGTNWSYTTVETTDAIAFDPVHANVSATVDAYGTVALPQIGEVAALRVNQLTMAQSFLGGIQYFREYYWLVPGIGKAVHVISAHSDSPPPLGFTNTYEVRRMFEANSLSPPPVFTPVANLHIQTQGGLALLTWQPATNASGYRVDGLGTLATTNWQSLGLPTTNFWSDSLTATQRFYRVYVRP